MFPDAPVRFSMMTGWLSDRRKCSATTRARMSVEPSGGKGTTKVTVRSGYAWPRACPNGAVAASPAKPASTDRRLDIFIVVSSMPRLFYRPGYLPQRPQPAVAGDIRREDGSEPPFDARLGLAARDGKGIFLGSRWLGFLEVSRC